MANFWTDGRIEPKRQNRWIVQFDGVYGGNMFFATKVTRPAVEIGNKEHKFLNHTFNYPGRAVWKPITLTMVDTAGGGQIGNSAQEDARGYNTMERLMQMLKSAGYVVPANSTAVGSLATIAKGKAINTLSKAAGTALGPTPIIPGDANGITIQMVGPEGQEVEKWTLKNAYITKFTPSELSYEDDNIATVDIEIVYDYCEFGTVDFKV